MPLTILNNVTAVWTAKQDNGPMPILPLAGRTILTPSLVRLALILSVPWKLWPILKITRRRQSRAASRPLLRYRLAARLRQIGGQDHDRT